MFAVDILGAIGALMIVIGYFDTRLANNILGLLQNGGVQIVGSWLSVRVIELILRRKEDLETARTRVLRNARWWVNALRDVRYAINANTLERISHELRYTTYMTGEWKSYLHPSEIDKLDKMLLILTQVDELAREVADIQSHLQRLHSDREQGYQRELMVRLATSQDQPTKPDPRPIGALTILKQQLRLVNSEIIELDPCLKEARSNWEAAQRALGESDAIEILDEAFIDDAETCLRKKAELREHVNAYLGLVAALEIDIREETPERWN